MEKNSKKNSTKDIKGSLANKIVCYYCKNIIIEEQGSTGYNREGCKLVQNDKGQYARLIYMEGDEEICKEKRIDYFKGLIGCNEFKSSGLPIHPSIIEEMISKNSFCESIPQDENATESFEKFEKKMKQYLSGVNYISAEIDEVKIKINSHIQ